MSYETIETERRGGALTIRLNRPDALNALNHRAAGEVRDALREAGADASVRAICLTGAGRAFCSGADLKAIGDTRMTPSGHPDVAGPMRELYGPMILAVRAAHKPVVAAVNGGASGIGASLALACDLVVAHESAYFLLAFVHINLVPDGGAIPIVGAKAGLARATEMAMLGERIGAEKALEWGLVNRVLPAETFESGAATLVDTLAAGPTLSYAGSKRQVNASLYAGLDEHIELEAELQQQMAATHDFMEGVVAFSQKRPPVFKGE